MTLVKGDFENAPDEVLPIGAGRIELLINEPPEHKMSRKGNPMVVMQMRVATEGPDKGRGIRDYIVNPGDQSSPGMIKLKRIAMSAGVSWTPEGFDTDELIGKTVVADIINAQEAQTDQEGNVITDSDGQTLTATRARIRGYVVSK